MATPVTRSQLQKQPSVDHEDSEHEFSPKESSVHDDSEVQSTNKNSDNVTVESSELSTAENQIQQEDPQPSSTTDEPILKQTRTSSASGDCDLPMDDTHSQLIHEYRALKIKVDGMYEKNENEPVLDDNKEDMLSFVVRILSIPLSDKLSPDRQHLLECNAFLEKALLANPSVIALSSISKKSDLVEIVEDSENSSKKVSVEWTNDEPRARMIMHKLCAFYGLHHNIVGQQHTTTIRVDFDPSCFVEWRCSLVELARFLELKRMLGMDSDEVSSTTNLSNLQNLEAKTILKRNPSHGPQAGMSNYGSGETRLKTYEDRHNRYYQRRRELGLYSNEQQQQQPPVTSVKKNQRGVRQMHSMPTHDASSREQLARTRLDAQSRSRTTDLEGSSYIVGDGAYVKSDFMNSDLLSVHNGSVAIMSSASDASSPSEAMTSLVYYPITESTVVYKLIPTELKACNPDEDLYVLPQGCHDPTLLRTPDGKPFRNAISEFPRSGTIFVPSNVVPSLSASLSDCHLNKAGATSPGQSSGSSAQLQSSQFSGGNSNNSNLSTSGNSVTRNKPNNSQWNRSNSVPHGRSGQLRQTLTPPPVQQAAMQQGISAPVGMIPLNSTSQCTPHISYPYATPLLQQAIPITSRQNCMSGGSTSIYPQASITPPNLSQNQPPMGNTQPAQYFGFQQFPGQQIPPCHLGEQPYVAGQQPVQVCPAQSSPLISGQSPAPTAYLSPGVLPYPTVMVSPSYMISHQLASSVQPQRIIQSQQFSGQIPIPSPQQTFQIHNQSQPPLAHSYTSIGANILQPVRQSNSSNVSYQQNRAGNAHRLTRPNGRQSGSLGTGSNSNAPNRGGESH